MDFPTVQGIAIESSFKDENIEAMRRYECVKNLTRWASNNGFLTRDSVKFVIGEDGLVRCKATRFIPAGKHIMHVPFKLDLSFPALKNEIVLSNTWQGWIDLKTRVRMFAKAFRWSPYNYDQKDNFSKNLLLVMTIIGILKKLNNSPNEKLNLNIFSLGHRNPQGITKIDKEIFSVEHGPKGGDELNKIIKDKNYGWPIVSYGTQYFYDENGKAYEISHENNQFEEPLFALVPSVGISTLNTCPSKLKNYYKKPCLLALSLYGNDLRPGRSIIIYLLSEKMNQVHSIEKIYLRDDLILRHFVTNSENELYEDKDGNIYISADKEGIYKLSFIEFRN